MKNKIKVIVENPHNGNTAVVNANVRNWRNGCVEITHRQARRIEKILCGCKSDDDCDGFSLFGDDGWGYDTFYSPNAVSGPRGDFVLFHVDGRTRISMAENLEELKDILNIVTKKDSYSFVDPRKLANLPTFGGKKPDCKDAISWDKNRILKMTQIISFYFDIENR